MRSRFADIPLTPPYISAPCLKGVRGRALKRETTIFCEKQTLKKKDFGNLIKYQESALIPALMIKRELINF